MREYWLEKYKKWRNSLEKYFYCYSYPLKEFFVSNEEQVILSSIHEKTKKKFWVFKSNDRMTE